ncbi:MAG: ribonuclease PH [Clostridia bacterium]|nr:ribonuclease PH [Clostridia bacterium]
MEKAYDEIRTVKITNNYLMHPEGSVLIEMGNTKVICTASVEEATAKHLTGTGKGWITAEYSMLPRSTATRKKRDSAKGKVDGRSTEIQRLIGRSLRSVVDMEMLGERTIWIDCDVIQADGGTRTASITGAFVAMVEAMKWMKSQGMIEEIPVRSFVSAISVGIVDGQKVLDLYYELDSRAQVDMNVVMTDKGEYIEVQGTGEESPFTREDLNELLELAKKGCSRLHELQKEIVGVLE